MKVRLDNFRLLLLISFGLFFASAFSGCLSNTPDTGQINTTTAKVTDEVQAGEIIPTVTNGVILPSPTYNLEQSTPNDTATDTPDVLQIPMPRSGSRSGLEASDPKEVELASGQLQLIEFFAFW